MNNGQVKKVSFFGFEKLKSNHGKQVFLLIFCSLFSVFAQSATYNLSNGQFPPCSTSWNASGTTFTCTGNGRVTLANGDILSSNDAITVVADNGFSLNNNTVGSISNSINLQSNYGTINSSGTNIINGNVTASSSQITLANTTVAGLVSTGGSINLTGGSVGGQVTTVNNTITTNGTDLFGGARSQSGMSITGGTIVGDFVMTSNNTATFSGVTMNSGSISGASNVVISSSSNFGNASNSILISSNSGSIDVTDNSTVFGDLTAPNSSTVNVNSGGVVNGTCSPNSTPANACNAATSASLVASWNMDEFSWNGTADEVVDASGNGFDGRAVNGPTTSDTTPAISGNPGTCSYGEFDGSGDYIEVGNISDTLNATASMAFWINTTQTGNDTDWQAPGIAGVEENGGEDDIFWGWMDSGGRIGVSVGNNSSTKSTVSINDGTWHHVALTRDHVAGTYKIYVDGNLDVNGSIQTGVIGNGYSSIGRTEDTGSVAQYFQGQLDEVKIYSGVLSDAEVTSIMTETHPCPADMCPASVVQGGLTGDYYNSTDFTGGIVGSRLDATVNFDWGSGNPGVSGINDNQFSVRWTGFIRVTESGDYNFQTVSDDGVRLTLNSQIIVERFNDHGATTDTSAPISLVAGQAYPILLEFYENGGLAEIRLRWQTPSSGSFVTIPAGPSVLGAGLYSCSTQVVSYYGISHSGSGITCEASPITITAYDAADSPVNPANGTTITLATTPATGTWASTNSYSFSGSESSTIKYLRQTTASTLNVNVTDGSASESATLDPDISFTDVGLQFYGDTASSPLPNQVAGVLDTSTVLRIVETSNDTGACVARIQNTNRDVELGYECRNPATCSAGQILSLDGSGVQENDNGATISYSTVNLSFDADGFAAIPFEYSDVGLIRLHGEIDLPEEINDPAITIVGSSAEFIVKPDSVAIIAVETSGGVANPASQQVGTGFVAAGENFAARIEGRNADGNRTPAFGRESTPERVQVAINQLVFPAGGNSGSLSNVGAFSPLAGTPGVYENTDLSWNEVGSLRLLPSLSDGDYLGSGIVNGVQSEIVGRFYPVDFNLSSSAVTNSCPVGGFSYLSDPSVNLEYQIAARNLSGSTVSNYDNTDLNYLTAAALIHGENDNDGVDRANRISVVTTTWDDGLLTVSDPSASVNRLVNGSLNTIPDGPFDNFVAGLSIGDSDGAVLSTLDMKPDDNNDCIVDGDCSAKQLSGSLDVRFGRMVVEDGHGPESAAVPMQWQMEYWNGTRFELNTEDQCTQLPISALSFVGATTSVDAANDMIAVDIGGVSSDFNFGDRIGADNCMSSSNIGFCDGRAGVEYGAPGAVATYPIDFNLIGLDFLQGDWNQNGSYDDVTHPRVYIRFQHYRGHDRVIYWRERLQ